MNLETQIKDLGVKSKKASRYLSNASNEMKNNALKNLAEDLKKFSKEIIEVNKQDLDNAHSMKLSSAMIDRLTLTEERINGMIISLNEIINLKNPVGTILSKWKRPKGYILKRYLYLLVL